MAAMAAAAGGASAGTGAGPGGPGGTGDPSPPYGNGLGAAAGPEEVDYGATAEELEAHFHGCGSVNRVTILCDKYSGHPKGFAYIEFSDKESVRTSMALDESLFRGRQIKVIPKRTNRPGISSTDRGFPRGRFRGRGGGYGSARSRFYSGYTRPRARGYRSGFWAQIRRFRAILGI
ncbi:PREDICTED: polyadenylate-binding protein 2-like, partial [Sturnus vulgaris]|uniref:polyadenylate-binding protein 2-like n=1 Tax=Sturnus vulgaris TaxID=9172 RepID=UPI000719F30B